MDTTKYKTNIKCAACIAKVTPYLDEVVGPQKWEVDITNPSKIMTVTGNSSEDSINEALKKVGYHVERI